MGDPDGTSSSQPPAASNSLQQPPAASRQPPTRAQHAPSHPHLASPPNTHLLYLAATQHSPLSAKVLVAVALMCEQVCLFPTVVPNAHKLPMVAICEHCSHSATPKPWAGVSATCGTIEFGGSMFWFFHENPVFPVIGGRVRFCGQSVPKDAPLDKAGPYGVRTGHFASFESSGQGAAAARVFPGRARTTPRDRTAGGVVSGIVSAFAVVPARGALALFTYLPHLSHRDIWGNLQGRFADTRTDLSWVRALVVFLAPPRGRTAGMHFFVKPGFCGTRRKETARGARHFGCVGT